MHSTELLLERIRNTDTVVATGTVAHVVGLLIEAEGVDAGIGEICRLEPLAGGAASLAEVVGFSRGKVLLMPFDRVDGIRPGYRVRPLATCLRVPVGSPLLGRIVNGIGEPIDSKGDLVVETRRSTGARSPLPLERRKITDIMETGVKAIDGCLTCGKGQRLGIFSGSGVGKSTLLGMICRNAEADVNVVALIGERGREVSEFIEESLGSDGLARSVVVAVTSDESPLMRIKGAETAMTIAEYFRDQGKNVIFIMDSVTRYAMALREVSLSAGEVPTARGYTPSVFARLPVLLERAGTSLRGSITAFISVLVEGDEIQHDPITDTIRAILDGHVVLSRRLANSNVFPAIDLLQSISRLARSLVGESEMARMSRLLDLLAVYTESEDLINLGAYVAGTNKDVDEAISKIKAIRQFVRQRVDERVDYEHTQKLLAEITETE